MPARSTGEFAQHAGRHDLARLAAGEEVDRPGGVARRRLGEVALQRVDLGTRGVLASSSANSARSASSMNPHRCRSRHRRRTRGFRRSTVSAAVCTLPAASSSSWPYSVAKRAGLEALLAQPAHHHRLIAMRDDDALGAGRADRALQAGPIGVVAQHEAAVDARAAGARRATASSRWRRHRWSRRSGASTASSAPTAAR